MVLDFEDVDDSGECVVLFLELVVLCNEFLDPLQQSGGILQARDPQDLTEFRSVIRLRPGRQCPGGVKDIETAAIASQIRPGA